ncbi:aldehyde dehydrogenase family protein [Novosphingobium resinovorum]|uniref:Aldehyde dehydrogenase n=1 Tax=Novosphingobium resinovorum TaxID=158500 RepID=A0A031JP28_9SPHN|nr:MULTISPECIES: aldehyde dehydrogenase family protein [Novosphingobium]AOR79574.1 aldehyde dehydrogenase [Novosphingobium resinovorum]EZP75698.1 Aldehyde dehydrogenase (Acceptor) [Novosphingobium resinovorum]MBF7013490.1 aldehyde dehydrogenase family protein [Novosphingobium sp. HR1a]WJM25638.1 aldehyde dehydrogenase family protein [Novosphingobium resinovorum]
MTLTAADFPVELSPGTWDVLRGDFPLLIDGKFVSSASGAAGVTHDPATGAALADFALGDAVDVDLAVRAAHKAFGGPWSKLSHFERARLLRKLADLFEANTQVLAELEVIDNGMPMWLAGLTARNNAELFHYYAGWAERIEGTTTTPPAHVLAAGEALTYTLREPVGVVGQIVPWNVPLSMACLKLAPALAAGCTVVLKPAEETPLSAVVLGRLIMEAGFPEGVVNIVNGDGATAGAALVKHPLVSKISFTGSTEVGKLIVRECADDLKKVSLELGGKSPVIVFPDADMAKAVPGVAMATFFLQGQNCMAGTRIFVHADIYDELLEGMAAFAGSMKIGHGLHADTMIGPLISAKQKARVMSFVEEAKAGPARVVAGGKAPEGPGHFVEPTIVADTTPDMRVVREEIFGPVMAVQRFEGDDLDAIAAMANDSDFGLSGSVWTQDLSTAHKMAARVRSGHVSVNTHGAVGANIPFGGFKQSGWGREFGREGLDLYLETKAVTVAL